MRFAVVAMLLAGPAIAQSAPDEEPRVELEEVAWSDVRGGVLEGTIEAPAERVYRALVDFSHWHEFMPFVAESTASLDAEGGVRCVQRLELPFPYADREYVLRATYGRDGEHSDGEGGAGWVVRWQDEGAAAEDASAEELGRETRAVVSLRPLAEERTGIVVRLWSDGGGLLPRRFQERISERSLRWIFDGLRQQVNRCRYDRPRATSCTEEAPFDDRSRS